MQFPLSSPRPCCERSFYRALKRRSLIKGAKSLARLRDKRAYLEERYESVASVRLIYFETLRMYNDFVEKKVAPFHEQNEIFTKSCVTFCSKILLILLTRDKLNTLVRIFIIYLNVDKNVNYPTIPSIFALS